MLTFRWGRRRSRRSKIIAPGVCYRWQRTSARQHHRQPRKRGRTTAGSYIVLINMKLTIYTEWPKEHAASGWSSASFFAAAGTLRRARQLRHTRSGVVWSSCPALRLAGLTSSPPQLALVSALSPSTLEPYEVHVPWFERVPTVPPSSVRCILWN